MVDALEIGYAIKKQRATLGITQEQLANASGVSKRCIWSLELGQNAGVQLDKLCAVLEALGLDLVLKTKARRKSKTGAAKKPRTKTTSATANAKPQPQTTSERAAYPNDVPTQEEILAILRGETL